MLEWLRSRERVRRRSKHSSSSAIRSSRTSKGIAILRLLLDAMLMAVTLGSDKSSEDKSKIEGSTYVCICACMQNS